jgi:hypothetical protein
LGPRAKKRIDAKIVDMHSNDLKFTRECRYSQMPDQCTKRCIKSHGRRWKVPDVLEHSGDLKVEIVKFYLLQKKKIIRKDNQISVCPAPN